MVLVNTGLKTPVILLKHEVTARVPITKQARFNFVGIEDLNLEKVEELREPRIILPEPRKPRIILPKPLNKKIVRIEPTKIWRDRDEVKGFLFNQMKGGYAVATAGFIALPFRSPFRRSGKLHKNRKKNRKFRKSLKFRFHKSRSRSGKFENESLEFHRSRSGTSRRSRTSRIPSMNSIKRNIVVKEIRAAPISERKKHHRKPPTIVKSSFEHQQQQPRKKAVGLTG